MAVSEIEMWVSVFVFSLKAEFLFLQTFCSVHRRFFLLLGMLSYSR